VRALVEQGAIRPTLDRSYPLDRIVDAHRRAESARGSVMVTPLPALAAK
jgi:NADPH:quinone reductase-like Zn-dependent oxidoreductase